MNWITAGMILLPSQIALYLFIRKAQIQKVAIELYSFFAFVVPLIIFLFMVVFSKLSLNIKVDHIFLILITAVLFSYMGNFFSQRGILYAPNPGYSLAISRSFVLFTALAATIFFKAELTLQKLVAIFTILFFSSLILISKRASRKNKANSRWVWYSMTTLFCWIFLALMSKYILNLNIHPYVYLFYLYLFVTGALFIELRIRKTKIDLNQKQLITLLFLSVFAMITNLFIQLGYKYAPNLGYIDAISSSSTSLITIFAAIFFKDHLSFKKMIGVMGVTSGLVLLFL